MDTTSDLAHHTLVKNLGAKIRAQREALHLTQEQLAQCVGVSYQAVQAWEAGTIPRMRKFDRIAVCLKTSVDELFYGKLPTPGTTQAKPVVQLAELRGRVPLITWSQAGEWQKIQQAFHPGDAEKWLHVTVRVGTMAFALRVVGDSMEPRVPDGSIVVVDPDKEATHGAIVLAKHDATVSLRQLWHDGMEEYLRPLNEHYPTLPLPPDATIIGVAVQVILDL